MMVFNSKVWIESKIIVIGNCYDVYFWENGFNYLLVILGKLVSGIGGC